MNTSENDLQKAIDDIAKAHGGGAATATTPTPPVGETPAADESGAAPSYIATDGQVPASEPVAPTTPALVPEPVPAPVVPEAPAEEEAKVEPEPEAEEVMDSDSVRTKAIEDLKPMIGTVDLTPILSKVDLLPETKFKIYKDIIETTRDQEVLPAAYATAKEITSDEARAEALLYIVEMVDRLG